eukprot:m.36958 g.36958  ORF g.36958 m.36958 type:complete len:512 (-) comp9215_c0_seq2:249-1784(-)
MQKAAFLLLPALQTYIDSPLNDGAASLRRHAVDGLLDAIYAICVSSTERKQDPKLGTVNSIEVIGSMFLNLMSTSDKEKVVSDITNTVMPQLLAACPLLPQPVRNTFMNEITSLSTTQPRNILIAIVEIVIEALVLTALYESEFAISAIDAAISDIIQRGNSGESCQFNISKLQSSLSNAESIGKVLQVVSNTYKNGSSVVISNFMRKELDTLETEFSNVTHQFHNVISTFSSIRRSVASFQHCVLDFLQPTMIGFNSLVKNCLGSALRDLKILSLVLQYLESVTENPTSRGRLQSVSYVSFLSFLLFLKKVTLSVCFKVLQFIRKHISTHKNPNVSIEGNSILLRYLESLANYRFEQPYLSGHPKERLQSQRFHELFRKLGKIFKFDENMGEKVTSKLIDVLAGQIVNSKGLHDCYSIALRLTSSLQYSSDRASMAVASLCWYLCYMSEVLNTTLPKNLRSLKQVCTGLSTSIEDFVWSFPYNQRLLQMVEIIQLSLCLMLKQVNNDAEV